MCKVTFHRYWCTVCKKLNHFTREEATCPAKQRESGTCTMDIVNWDKTLGPAYCDNCKAKAEKEKEKEKK
ncbi:hypothetical protein ACJZ2D_006528 [Fusarium nematophilum]